MCKKAYRLNKKIYSDPVLEVLRRASIRAGISYVISIGGNKRRFFCTEDAWKYYIAAGKADCDYLYFVGMLASGCDWKSKNVKVWKSRNK